MYASTNRPVTRLFDTFGTRLLGWFHSGGRCSEDCLRRRRFTVGGAIVITNLIMSAISALKSRAQRWRRRRSWSCRGWSVSWSRRWALGWCEGFVRWRGVYRKLTSTKSAYGLSSLWCWNRCKIKIEWQSLFQTIEWYQNTYSLRQKKWDIAHATRELHANKRKSQSHPTQ
jgi:hypothetical protein